MFDLQDGLQTLSFHISVEVLLLLQCTVPAAQNENISCFSCKEQLYFWKPLKYNRMEKKE